MNLLKLIQSRIAAALEGLAADPQKHAVLVKATQDAKFGDYQANCAMPLAKELGKPPREIAAQIVAKLDTGDLLETPEIAGPGFINLRVKNDWLAEQVGTLANDDRLAVSISAAPQRVVIDFSSPNVAKPLHVGHLRSTIIGDAITRILRFLGHTVIADNHLGDWGTQFGTLIHGYKHHLDPAAYKADPVRELSRLYKYVQALTVEANLDDETPLNTVAEACRKETALLHAGDPENTALWREFMPACLAEIEPIYRLLGVKFDHMHGESFYNPMLPAVVVDLMAKGIAKDHQAAVYIFENDEPTTAVRKTDGAFTYTTTDLATIRYRADHFNSDASLYVVDARQSLHFSHLFATARRWGYDRTALEHVSFGSVLGPDRKPLKTRAGNAPELGELLDEAVKHGAETYERSRQERADRGEEVPELSDTEKRSVAEVVGLGAVKYADLSQHRATDYVFAWDKMLATDGNTATYMQYAFARCRSIFRRGEIDVAALRAKSPSVELNEPTQRALALQLLRFEESLESAAAEYLPHIVTAYLWDVAKAYSRFFDACPVLKSEGAVRDSRLLLCDLTARTLQQSLGLLGIGTVERM